ncbi:histidine N-acetyltransferase-like [Polymixia lowei]
MAFPEEVCNNLEFSLAEQSDFDQVALASALVVDDGKTIVVQGLRVAASERGQGIAGAIQRHVTEYVRCHYPQVTARRLARGDVPSPEQLTKYRIIAKEAILSLCCEATDLGLFLTELHSKLHSEAGALSPVTLSPVTLSQPEAEALVLSDYVVSTLLPGGTIVNDWEPLRPVQANLEVLRRRGLTWISDRRFEPSALSLCTVPYPVPLRHDALHFNINVFGRSLSSVCVVFLAQLRRLLPRLHGYLVFHTYVDPGVWAGLRDFCQNSANVSFFKDYWEELLLETDL